MSEEGLNASAMLYGEGYKPERPIRLAPLTRPLFVQEAPPGWLCNARKDHAADGRRIQKLVPGTIIKRPCLCHRCLQVQYRGLRVGKVFVADVCPFPEELMEADFVGIYAEHEEELDGKVGYRDEGEDS